MNNMEEKRATSGFLKRSNAKIKDLALLFVLGMTLIAVAWTVFRGGDTTTSVMESMTDTEIKVLRILQEIDGVGEANVVVCETKEGVESVVVVCQGANDLRVVMNVREAVATALGTTEKSVKIYLKKE